MIAKEEQDHEFIGTTTGIDPELGPNLEGQEQNVRPLRTANFTSLNN